MQIGTIRFHRLSEDFIGRLLQAQCHRVVLDHRPELAIQPIRNTPARVWDGKKKATRHPGYAPFNPVQKV